MARSRHGLTIVEVLIIGAVLVLAIGLLIPVIMRLRAASDRNRCTDQLRRLGLALHAYHDGYACFPIACDMNPAKFGYRASGNLGWQKYWMLSWSTRILPYLEQDNLYRQMDIAEDDMLVAIPDRYFPFDNNRFVGLGVALPVFHCPADGRDFRAATPQGLQAGCTSYLGVSGVTTMGSQLAMATEEMPTDTRPMETDPQTGLQTGCNGVLVPRANLHNPPPTGIRIAEIKDGLANTLMVGERPPSSGLGLGWMFAGFGNTGVGDLAVVLGVSERAAALVDPDSGQSCSKLGDADPASPMAWKIEPGALTNFCDAMHFWSLHAGGGNFILADGSVRFISYGVSSSLQRALATRAGND
jgi:prepilin-type processing-associated H-X9-DG protein